MIIASRSGVRALPVTDLHQAMLVEEHDGTGTIVLTAEGLEAVFGRRRYRRVPRAPRLERIAGAPAVLETIRLLSSPPRN